MSALASYISGYVDGEGCFCVSFQPSVRHCLGWEIRPSFSVSQNADRSEILELIRDKWKCGSIRPDRSDKTLKFEVRSVTELLRVVIPHFEAFPLLSTKQRDFERFAVICRIIGRGAHLRRGEFKKLARIAFTMNPSGRRKYSLEEILGSLGSGKTLAAAALSTEDLA
ncbi:MAG: LAGLIDADG family homing endonuclease [Proteobacteria bacterium]|nr:LAGLIDADG family homing endonuclease [Pseudomonadota bacterium]